jgi:hypothetical protein
MVRGRPFLGGVAIPPYIAGEFISLAEGPNEGLVWRVLRSFEEVPDRGRSLFSGTLRERNQQYRQMKSYLRQARTYFEAGASTSGSAAALPYYYCALNLAKVEVMVHLPGHILPGERIGHGLTTRWSKTPRLSADRLIVRDGVFPLLYRARTGRAFVRQPIPVMKLMRNVPEISYEVERAGANPAARGVYHAAVRDETDAWGLLAIPRGHPVLSSQSTMRFLRQPFREIDAPTDPAKTFGLVTSRFPAAPCRYFESRTSIPVRDSRGRIRRELFGVVSQLSWDALRPIAEEACLHWSDLIISPSLLASRFAPMPPGMARYAAMYYASEVVRYQPGRFDLAEGGELAWLLEAFVEQAALPGIISSMCSIDQRLYLFQSADTFRH